MALISRATKSGSPDGNYVPGTTILSAEVNADFNTMYGDYDGNITNANIAPTAGIVYSKLSLTGSVVNGDVASGAAILRAKLAPAVTSLQTVSSGVSIGTTPTSILTATLDITSTGGSILILPAATLDFLGAGVDGDISFQYKIDGTNSILVKQRVACNIKVPLAAPGCLFAAPPAPGLHHIDLIVTCAIGIGTVDTNASNPGYLFAIEI